jgi:hypothetical protein
MYSGKLKQIEVIAWHDSDIPQLMRDVSCAGKFLKTKGIFKCYN